MAMRVVAFLAAAVTAAFLIGIPPAGAQAQQYRLEMMCAPADQVERVFSQTRGELPAGRGITDKAGAVVLRVNPDTASWAAILYDPQAPGLGCILAVGGDWQPLDIEAQRDRLGEGS